MKTLKHHFDWVGYVNGEVLSKQQRMQALAHLESCEECQREVDELRQLEQLLRSYRPEPLEDGFISETLDLLAEGEGHPGVQPAPLPSRKSSGWWAAPNLRRLGLVAASVLFTLLVQWLVWTPFSTGAEVRTVFAFSEGTPPPAREKQELQLEAHEEGLFSSNFFHGRKDPEEIAKFLGFHGLQFESLRLWAPEWRPVQVDLSELSPILEAFQINQVHLAGGVQGVLESLLEGEGEPVDRGGSLTRPGDSQAHSDSSVALSLLNSSLGQAPAQIHLLPKGEQLEADRALLSAEEARRVLKRLLEDYPQTQFILLEDSTGSTPAAREEWSRRLQEMAIPFSRVQ